MPGWPSRPVRASRSPMLITAPSFDSIMRSSLLLTRRSAGVRPGDATPGSPGHHPCARGVIAVEQPPDHLPGRVEARNRSARHVLNLPAARLDLQTAKGEGNAAADGVALERRLVDRQRVIRLVDLQSI